MALATALAACACTGTPRDPQPARAPAPASLPSPLAATALPVRAAPPFTFVTCGHVYGAPGAGHARPAATFTDNLGRLRATGAEFVMLLGDCVYEWHAAELDRLHALAANELRLPVFNAPGNHDLADPPDYERRFGPRRLAFDHGGCRLLVVDTEVDPWHVAGAQLDWLLAELAAIERTPPRALFVFGHKPVWALTRAHAVAALASNDPRGLATALARDDAAPTFRRDVLPALRRAAAHAPVWWFAGDVGAFEPNTLHLYHGVDELAPDLHFVAVGLGDRPRDCFVRVDVPAAGSPRVSAIELASGREVDLAAHGPQAWMSRLFPDGLPAAVQAIVDTW